MNKYIIEIDSKKLFTYEAEGEDKNFRCRLMRPHGDKFHSVEQKKSEPEEIPKPEDINESAELPDELREKISAEDLQSYIEEQTDGQCDGVSFKKTSP